MGKLDKDTAGGCVMGHYRSEMGFEEQDRLEAERRAKALADLTKGIKADIKKRGIEKVLADIVTDIGAYRRKRFD